MFRLPSARACAGLQSVPRTKPSWQARPLTAFQAVLQDGDWVRPGPQGDRYNEGNILWFGKGRGMQMEFNRNQFFMIGLIVLFIGIQVKCVQAYVVNEDVAKFVAKRINKDEPAPAATAITRPFATASAAVTGDLPSRSFQPPKWLGWALIAVGAVMTLHSVAMSRPNG